MGVHGRSHKHLLRYFHGLLLDLSNTGYNRSWDDSKNLSFQMVSTGRTPQATEYYFGCAVVCSVICWARHWTAVRLENRDSVDCVQGTETLLCEHRHVSIVGEVVTWYEGCRSLSLASLCFHLQGSSIESYTVVRLTHWSVTVCNGNILIFLSSLLRLQCFLIFQLV